MSLGHGHWPDLGVLQAPEGEEGTGVAGALLRREP